MDRKTLLIVDDDPSCTRFLVRKVHEETSLVAICAEDLEYAESLVADPRVRIDAVLTDIYFSRQHANSRFGLTDGLDLLHFTHQRRPHIKLYVVSCFSDSPNHHRMAETLAIPVSGWHDKFVLRGSEAVWKAIARDLNSLSATTKSISSNPSSLDGFDVFLAHNSKNKDDVELIAHDIEKHGLQPWLDKWNIVPGRSVLDEISKAIQMSRSMAVFVSNDGIGRFQDIEQKVAVRQYLARGGPLIPVLLNCGVEEVDLPNYLRDFKSVSFNRNIPYAESLADLVWGIKGWK